MPPRYTYWTIIFGGQATAFRSGTRDELVPTFKQIQSKHPDAQLRYFARGKLWYSEEEARAALIRDRRPPPRPDRPPRDPNAPRDKDRWRDRPAPPRSGEERRGRDWRPGGQHKDPRDRFKVPRDVKRARFKAQSRRDRIEPRPDRPRGPRPPFRKPPFRKPFKKKDEE